jgi:signal transduction histidine kinase
MHIALADEPIFVDGDVVRLHQIFLNILDNAIKYTAREGTIWISVQRQGSDAVIRIRDNGPGISAAMLPTVFEMFSQAGTTLDRSAGGLGIGLYLVKQLVELHNGSIEARSDGSGQGSEFMITLPALAACAPSAGIERPPQFAGELAPQIAHS